MFAYSMTNKCIFGFRSVSCECDLDSMQDFERPFVFLFQIDLKCDKN